MILLKRELRANRRSLVIWSVALGLFGFLMVSIYPSFAEGMEGFREGLSAYPEQFLAMFGLDRLDLGDPIGFYAIESYLIVILFGSIYAMILASTALSKEEDEKTAEFLLAKPISRSRVVGEKIASVLLLILMLNVFIGIVGLVGFEIFIDSYPIADLARLTVGAFLAHIAFAGIGFLVSLFVTRRRSAYSTGIGVVLALYFASLIATLSDRFEVLRYASPFWYMDGADIVTDGGLVPARVAAVVGVAVVASVLTWFLYSRRDIRL